MVKALLMMVLFYSGYSSAFCFADVANWSRVDPLLLGAIVKQESGFNAKAQNVNRKNGIAVSEDIGFAQINSSWLTNGRLRMAFPGITRERLYRDPCYNLYVSAWILINSCDMNRMDWDCVGAYNAGTKQDTARARLRKKYAKLIHSHFIKYRKYPHLMQRDMTIALQRKH
ncbi:lytic transglycosylase domain-containing protein [Aeromonas veronii]|uniref:lytic transglycosylase domain-containing protein n=1 Tax=Aeromonas veronii TaxID=654 RepID=UPI001C5B5DF6|nr:lytic transglycosylase domain-containing protein [Aeromonas veronii]MBW3779588.1 lytic transglycosylase domain-containing protein [Aeromonas veronii]